MFSIRTRLAGWLLIGLIAGHLSGQERPLGDAANTATDQERLLMEQIDQLAAAGQTSEAIASLERLVDSSEGRLIELGSAQRASTLAVQVYAPISQWAQRRLHRWSLESSEQMRDTLRGQQEMAQRASQAARATHNFSELQKVVDRFSLAPESALSRLFLSDLYLDRGWTVAARQALDAPGLALRVPLQADDERAGQSIGSLPWSTTWPHVSKSEQRIELLDRSKAAVTFRTEADSTEQLVAEVAARLVSIAAFDCPVAEFEDTCEWALALSERLPPEIRIRVTSSVAEGRNWFEQRQAQRMESVHQNWPTFAGNARRSATADVEMSIASWPAWTVQLERLTAGTDRNPASKPPVAENSLGLVPYHPVVHDGRVFVNQLTRIVAYDLKDGHSWPPSDPPLPVFDSGMTASNYLPFGYALMGAPRGTLTIEGDTLYARMGPPVTGWYGRAPGDAQTSLSYLIALDLKRQGSMHLGFPVRLDATQFPESEFEGAPLALGDQLVAAVGTRDNVNLRRWVISIDKATGAIRWRSPPLATGTVSGSEQASLVAHQLLTASGGRIFVNTNLGAIACLDQSNGQIVWLVRYRRSPSTIDQPYPRQDRFRYRDLTPCMVMGTQVICAPQDCPEVFALDSTSGDLLWSTDAERVDDATQLLGVSRNSIVMAGDRIFWLERSSGRVIAAFPNGSLGDTSSALPAPRGYGRGVIGAEHVYWPTQHEVFVFDADQAGRASNGAPAIRQRMRLDTHGAEGGNLVLVKDGILIAGASRLFFFKRFERP